MSIERLGQHARTGFFGAAFGFVLHNAGYTDYAAIQAMFLFEEFRLLLTFAGAVVFSGAGFFLLRKKLRPGRRPMHRGIVAGGVLFGVGWALTGACPSIAVVQVGAGRLAALFTVIGILAGLWLYERVHSRFFGWDRGSCDG